MEGGGKRQMSEVRCQRSDVRGPMSDVMGT